MDEKLQQPNALEPQLEIANEPAIAADGAADESPTTDGAMSSADAEKTLAEFPAAMEQRRFESRGAS